MWGIGYQGGQGCRPHNHRRNTYGAIYYLYGDIDAGKLEFPDTGYKSIEIGNSNGNNSTTKTK